MSLFLEETSLTLTSPTQINILTRSKSNQYNYQLPRNAGYKKRNFVELFDSMVDHAGKKRGWIIVVS